MPASASRSARAAAPWAPASSPKSSSNPRRASRPAGPKSTDTTMGAGPELRGPPSARRKTHGNSPAEQNSNPPQGLRRVGHRDGCEGDRGDCHAHRRDGLGSRAAADGERPRHGRPLALQGQGLPGALRDPHAQAADRHPPADAEDGRLAPAPRPSPRGRRHRDQAGLRVGATMPAILAKKLGMTQRFLDDGKVERVTVLEAGPCPVLAIRTQDTDGYEAVQLGFGAVREKALTRAEL